MKITLLLTSTVALFACVSTSSAAPASAKGKTARIHEIHCVQNAPCNERLAVTIPAANDPSLSRSRAELETVNPG